MALVISTIPGFAKTEVKVFADDVGYGNAAFQQTRISGKVSDDAGVGMPGVNVILKGSSNGATTDADGVYAMNISSDERDGILVFSFIGYAPQEVPINAQSSINVTLLPDIQQLTEVVVVGYGTQEKRDVTSSISTVSGEAISKIPTGNSLDALKGQVAGVDILTSSGQPGSTPTITIRGRRSLFASNDPLFVIDGIPMTSGTSTIADFNPADIASVEVLKDAASQAVYGSRGSNGVILVTTKRGTPGKTTVNLSTSYGQTQPFRLTPMMNGQQFAALKREANRLDATNQTGRAAWGDVGSTIPSDAAIFLDPVELNSVQNNLSTNWQDLIYGNGSQLNNQVSVTGGSEKTYIAVAFSRFNEVGIMPGTDQTRYTGRFNADHKIGSRFKLGVSSLYSNNITNFGSASAVSEAVNQSPLGLPYDADGKIIFLPISDGIRSNPLSELVPGKRIDRRKVNRLFTSAFVDAEIIKGLKYKFLFGIDYQNFDRGVFEGQYTNTRKNGTPSAQNDRADRFGYTMENLLTYTKKVGEHDFAGTILQSMARQTDSFTTLAAANLPYESAKWNNLGLGTVTSYGTNFSRYSLMSYMGRVNYSYKGKYLFQANIRWDGSSRLAPGHKWTSFPGVSVGWRIKDEAFMAGITPVSELKLRVSYGKVGHTAVPAYGTQGTLAQSLYDWNDTDARGFGLNQIPSPDLGWEYSKSFNAGLDFGLFNGKVSGFLDVYHTSTGVSLLLNRQLPPTSGYASILQNIGGTETKGFEITLNTVILDRPNGLKWKAEFNLGSLKEKIVDLAQRGPNGEKVSDVGNGWFIGQPVRSFYDLQKLGIWQASEKDQAAVYKQFPGEIKINDLNGDGQIDLTNDRKVLGNDVPKAYGGLTNTLSFKGVDLSIFFYYRLGFMIRSALSNDQATMQARYNNLNVDYWTIDNPTNSYPRPNKNQENITYGSSLQYMDGGYVKLRNVTLGYTLPASIATKLAMSKLRVYVSAQNPKVWSNYKLSDPENVGNIGSGGIPTTKMFLGGVQIGF
jgi:TonB-linked SusC/RagA family outer membrane protein